MRLVYKQERVPLQIRRLIIFSDICAKARSKPNKIVHLSRYTKLAFSVMYLQDCKKYVAYGGLFEYAHTRAEVVEQGVHNLPHDELVTCAITIKRQAFTKPVRTPIELLWHWNNYVRNRSYTYLGNKVRHFFPVNDELEMDFPPHRFHGRLVATARLPLWDDRDELIADVYRDNKGQPRYERYNKNRLI